MLQIYDRVLSSRSVPTLIALSVFLVGAYAFQGALDSIRSRVAIYKRNLGNMLRANARKVEAEAALRAATCADPMFAEAWYNLSDLLE